jgi:hypothetical protein
VVWARSGVFSLRWEIFASQSLNRRPHRTGKSPAPQAESMIRTMKVATSSIAALLALAMSFQLQAEPITIISPNQGQTRSDSTILRRGLHWNANQRKLTAVITFGNANYVYEANPRQEDTLAFELPGVQLDPEKNVFYAISKDGQHMPIAEWKRALFGKEIALLPGATIYAATDHGNVTVKLLVTDGPTPASRWVQLH